jgi:hypothetical protein
VAFGDAYAGGRLEVRGDLVRLLEAVYGHWQETPVGHRAEPPRRSPAAASRRAPTSTITTTSATTSIASGSTSSSSTPARTSPPRARPRRGADREVRPRLPQGAAAPGGDGGGSGLRMGRPRVAHGPPLRGHGQGLQHLARADPLRPRACAGGGAGRPGGVRGGRLPQRPQPAATSSSPVGMLEHVGQQELPRLRGGHRPLPGPRTVAAFSISSDATGPRALNAWIRKRIFPGAYPPDARRGWRAKC